MGGYPDLHNQSLSVGQCGHFKYPAEDRGDHATQTKVTLHATMNAASSTSPSRTTSGLVLWLACGLVVANLYAWLNLSGIARAGLGWKIKPGFLLLFLTIVALALEWRTIQTRKIIQVVLCLLAPIFLEYFSLPRPADSFLGIALTLLGQAILFSCAPKIRTPEVLLLFLSSYIQSVCIYNLFRGEQMMFFFKPAWTV